MSRIDYWLTSCSLQKYFFLINILPVPLTDHKAVSINVGLQSFSNNHYNSDWKLNNLGCYQANKINSTKLIFAMQKLHLKWHRFITH